MEEEKEERKISEKTVKIIIIMVVIVVVVAIALWGMVPEKTYEVREVMDDPATFQDRTMNVKGLVKDWTSTSNFTLADSLDETLTFNITHDGVFPEGFGNNETVVVKGVLKDHNGNLIIESTAIQIGCPSKY